MSGTASAATAASSRTGCAKRGPSPGVEAQAQAHRIGHGEDVAEQDRRVQRVALQRLQRDLGGELRVRRQAHEAAGALARGLVLGQVAAGLAHQPDRRVLGRLAQAGAQEGVVAAAVRSCADYPRRTGAPPAHPQRRAVAELTSAARAAWTSGKGSPASQRRQQRAAVGWSAPPASSSSGGSTRVAGRGIAAAARPVPPPVRPGAAHAPAVRAEAPSRPVCDSQPSRQPLRPAALPRCRRPPVRRARTRRCSKPSAATRPSSSVARPALQRLRQQRRCVRHHAPSTGARRRRAAASPAAPAARGCRLHEGLVAAVAAPRPLEDDDGDCRRAAARASAACGSGSKPRSAEARSLATSACTRPKRAQASARASSAEPSTPPPPTTSSIVGTRRGRAPGRSGTAQRLRQGCPWRRTVRSAAPGLERRAAPSSSCKSRSSIRPRLPKDAS